MNILLQALSLAVLVVGLCSIAYLLLAIVCTATFRGDPVPPSSSPVAVTILKPLCGDEIELETCVRSFFTQDYDGPVQIVFGVRYAGDPALARARQVATEFPGRDVSFVADGTIHGPNLKGSNLANMAGAARYDILVVSDSDALVAPDALSRLVSGLADPRVGAATCLFRGRPAPGTGLVGQIGALFIDAWFLPSAVIDARFSRDRVCFGPLTAIRRSVIEAGGGFGRLAHVLADDTELAHIAAEQGCRVAYAPMAVDTVLTETTGRALFAREVRWARTTRALRPFGYAASLVTHALPILAAGAFLSQDALSWTVLAAVVVLRALLLRAVQVKFGRAATAHAWSALLLIPRELSYFVVWAWAFTSRRIEWRGRALRIVGDARLQEATSFPGELPQMARAS